VSVVEEDYPVVTTIRLPKSYLDKIDILVKRGIFASRSEAIRTAVRELLQRENPEPPQLPEPKPLVKHIRLES
jgi:Arc/MetJ-type ribon-helix-helix transcriptional regulator